MIAPFPASLDGPSRRAHFLARRLTSLIDRSRIYQRIVESMAASVQADVAALAVYDPVDPALRICATHGYPKAIVEHVRFEPGEGVIGRVFAEGRMLWTVEGANNLEIPRRLRYRTQSCIVLPLKSTGIVLGVIAVTDPATSNAFTRADVRALRLLAPVASLALERERLRDEIAEVARAATIDPVTGLANRQYLESRLEAEMQRARRLRHPLAVLLVDLDDFKRVNDTWGHAEGDRLLRDVSDLLRQSVRIFDVCTRYGGEEFAIVMPGADQDVAATVADRVRRAVESAYRERMAAIHITLSVGVALLRPEDSQESLLSRADFALLDAKSAGKNTVRFATP